MKVLRVGHVAVEDLNGVEAQILQRDQQLHRECWTPHICHVDQRHRVDTPVVILHCGSSSGWKTAAHEAA